MSHPPPPTCSMVFMSCPQLGHGCSQKVIIPQVVDNHPVQVAHNHLWLRVSFNKHSSYSQYPKDRALVSIDLISLKAWGQEGHF